MLSKIGFSCVAGIVLCFLGWVSAGAASSETHPDAEGEPVSPAQLQAEIAQVCCAQQGPHR